MKRREDLTYKHNINRGRHGWLRLTPAYSIKLVQDILDRESTARSILDPFSGSGTTGLVAAERGLYCDLLDINPFLVWFARAKTFAYTRDQLAQADRLLESVSLQAQRHSGEGLWFPPIANIERWWPTAQLNVLGRLLQAIESTVIHDVHVKDLLLVVFCRCVISWSNAAFNHQSMSFRDHPEPSLFDAQENALLYVDFQNWGRQILESACTMPSGNVVVRLADARSVPAPSSEQYDCVITSPPYPNRMSYIRELRPYMYWLRYLTEAREAGELDWKAIGGTWGIATSRVAKWEANGVAVAHDGFRETIASIASTPASNAGLLANYVHRYFVDATCHIRSLFPHIRPNGRVYYIVGNSKFYDTMLHVEEIYASILREAGFTEPVVERIRKRNSKEELYEFVVSATKPL